MKIMICLFGNQKGGVGKSTLTVLSGNYLSLAKDWPVTIIDMDYQQSISQKFEKAKCWKMTSHMMFYRQTWKAFHP
jgi:cellulose biosynthesis protein BcsQ